MSQEQQRAPRFPAGRAARSQSLLVRILALASLALALAACGARDTENLGTDSQRVQALSQADVFGFESTAAWTPTQGTRALSSVRTEGQRSLAFSVGGYTEIRSVPLGSLGRAPEGFSFDLRLPQQQSDPWWLGGVQMFVSVPSKGINNHYLGQHELTGKPLERFFRLSYVVPPSVGARSTTAVLRPSWAQRIAQT